MYKITDIIVTSLLLVIYAWRNGHVIEQRGFQVVRSVA